ncbi:MAG: hypothetical protein QM607_10770 [Microbacterium sp.]
MTTTHARPRTAAEPRLTLSHLLTSERIKLTSRRSTFIIGGLILVMMVATAASMVFGLDTAGGVTAQTVAGLVTGGVVGAQFAGLALGAIAVGGEYKTGRIRSVLNADPGRIRTLVAKAVVTAAVAFTVTLVSAIVAYAAAQLVLVFTGAETQLIDATALRMLLGAALHVSLITVAGVGMAAALRKTAPGVSVMIALIWTLPAAASILPAGIAGTVVSYMPSTAGASLYAAGAGQSAAAFAAMSVRGAETLPFFLGLAVLIAWVALFWGLGAWLTKRRDI